MDETVATYQQASYEDDKATSYKYSNASMGNGKWHRMAQHQCLLSTFW